MIKEIDIRIFKFLWGKRDRIKRKSVINSLEDGGLNMMDVRSQLSAIKASWATRIVNAPDHHLWSYLPKMYLSVFGPDYLILKTSVTEKNAFSLLDTIPAFYKEVIFSYNRSKIVDYNDFSDNLMTQPIWGNKFIKFKGKTLFFKSWVRVGILALGNLRIINGRLDANYLANLVQDYRNYYREINILQTALRNANINVSFEPDMDIILPKFTYHTDMYYEWECQKSKYYYVKIIEDVKARPTAEQFWYRMAGVSENDIHTAYVRKVKMIKDKKLAETYFKILNNILPCNRNLYKWGKTDSMLCYFCNENETISHLLFECTYAKNVWRLIQNVFFIDKEITHDMVLFGKDLSMSLNYIFSIVVYYIYREFVISSLEKKQRRVFSNHSFRNYLKIRANIYKHCESKIWHEICILLDTLIGNI